ncbi:MAG: exopolysaccharide biosynthesis polyprenyl glycosylphosphotransferase [Acidimicrobiia bacterium]
MARPDLGRSAPVHPALWDESVEPPRLSCVSTRAGDSARQRSLRELISTPAAVAVVNGSTARVPVDVPIPINPYVVAAHSRLADVLTVVAPRAAFPVETEPRSRNRLVSWLLDDRTSLARDADDVANRFLAAGVPAQILDPVHRADGVPIHDATWLRERAAAPWDLPLDRRWVLHLCTIRNRRDAFEIAATLRRELHHADAGPRPLLVVVGAGTGKSTLARLVARHGTSADVALLGDIADPSWLIAASDAVVLLGEHGAEDALGATARSHPVFGSTKVAPRLRRRTVILGSGDRARELAAVLADRRSSNDVIGFLTHDRDRVEPSLAGGPLLGTFSDLFHVVEKEQIQAIAVALDEHDRTLPTEALFDLKTTGVEVVEGMHLLEQVSGRIHIDEITPYRVIFSDGFRRPRVVVALKRASDAGIAAVGLVVMAPVLALLGLLVRLDSPGPIIYRQLRIGLNGRPFSIWKFRSMRADAECVHSPVWASEADPRITRIGRWMRTWRLDELPQLVNVLRGEMSLVGPRPERPTFVQDLRADIAYYDLRHTVRPGITGWAQVRFPYAASKEESYQKLQYDLYYVKHMSLRLDARIAAETLRVMTRGEGAR